MNWLDQELSEERKEAIIQAVVQRVSRYRMEMPAILFLEMHKPLSFLASQAVIVGSPFMVPFLGFERVGAFSAFLKDRENVERLIRCIEQAAVEREEKDRQERARQKQGVKP